jgi:ATP-binding cassette subfamily B multidrug efflux pump
MFRFFETLVDPYQPYSVSDTPPRRLWPFLKEYVRPFRGVFAVTAALSVISAFADVALIWYVGRLVDYLAENSPADVWARHGTEMLMVAAAILILRPLLLAGTVALLHNSILPNFGTMIRWRAHNHVIRQPVGWFESDFAGRIANRIMQTPPAAGWPLPASQWWVPGSCWPRRIPGYCCRWWSGSSPMPHWCAGRCGARGLRPRQARMPGRR